MPGSEAVLLRLFPYIEAASLLPSVTISFPFCLSNSSPNHSPLTGEITAKDVI
jgi:hypothetical protein